MDTITVLDFGSQYAQLIARRLREAHVYSELYPHDAPADEVLASDPKGFILSGGPASVYEPGAPQVPDYVLDSRRPVLGICYGMQALTHALNGRVAPAARREYGRSELEVVQPSNLLPAHLDQVWMSHGDRIEAAPSGFRILARSDNSPIAAIGDPVLERYGIQFHPEVRHTPGGRDLLRAFAVDVCGAAPTWSPASIVESAVKRIRAQVGDSRVLAAVSGGVDSSVAAALVQRAVQDQLTCVFVNTGLLRAGEPESVVETFRGALGAELHAIDATEQFFDALRGVTDPEEKRRAIGRTFIRVFEREADKIGQPPFLVQGTIYPDVVESRGPERQQAARIKSHHNVGGLPEDYNFDLVEPLRYLFKDEVRRVGLKLGLPENMIWRQPFPGPGLAVRCLGEITLERVERLRQADRIFLGELTKAGLLGPRREQDGGEPMVAQAFAVLLPVRSVGVMGDKRTYAETIALRAVTTEDFMTADWARLPADLLARVSSRIVNEVAAVNRVVYDISSKPPATIEWE
ncbi:MAG: glutamine-hydrolyzing GMP synthase [Anaerolineales bacterium]|nr:glutamine-hydrolyzing GMP synthase [Anaerolineales bacterium]